MSEERNPVLDPIVYGEIKYAKLRDSRDRMSRGGLKTKNRNVIDVFECHGSQFIARTTRDQKAYSAGDIRRCSELLDEWLAEYTDNVGYRTFVREAFAGRKAQSEIARRLGLNPNTARSILSRFCRRFDVLTPKQTLKSKHR